MATVMVKMTSDQVRLDDNVIIDKQDQRCPSVPDSVIPSCSAATVDRSGDQLNPAKAAGHAHGLVG